MMCIDLAGRLQGLDRLLKATLPVHRYLTFALLLQRFQRRRHLFQHPDKK